MKEEILAKSKTKINRLKLYCNYFDNQLLRYIYIKTQSVHSLFNDDIVEGLDINNLVLFHVQYTDSLLELLIKIKKQNDQTSLLILNDIKTNNDILDTLTNNSKTDSFELDRKYHSSNISYFLKNIFNNLTDQLMELDYGSIKSFEETYSEGYFREIDPSIFDKDTLARYYEFDGVKIQSRLMGKLNKAMYNVRFLCGYIGNNTIYELFRFFKSDELFIWDVTNKEFFLISNTLDIDMSTNTLIRKSLREELIEKNEELEKRISNLKNTIPQEVLDTLSSYKEMIDDTNKLVSSFCFDEETNILKSMLNLNLKK